MGYGLWVMGYGSRVSGYGLYLTGYWLWVMVYSSGFQHPSHSCRGFADASFLSSTHKSQAPHFVAGWPCRKTRIFPKVAHPPKVLPPLPPDACRMIICAVFWEVYQWQSYSLERPPPPNTRGDAAPTSLGGDQLKPSESLRDLTNLASLVAQRGGPAGLILTSGHDVPKEPSRS
jgi:hypothetical protein